MAKHRTLHDLALHHLRDLYDAERHIAKVLPKMAKAAVADALREALARRHDQAASHVEALEAMFERLDKKAHASSGAAMHGLIEDTKALIDHYDDSPAIDAALIAAAQAMDHYVVARCDAVRLWAGQLGESAVVGSIDAILSESRRALEVWAALAGAGAAAAPDAPRTLTLKQAALMGIG